MDWTLVLLITAISSIVGFEGGILCTKLQQKREKKDQALTM